MGVSQPAKFRALVVDDEAAIRELVSLALRHEGVDVVEAGTGTEALRRAEVERPDVVILDVMLPDHSGFEVARRLRAARDQVPVLFLTARDRLEDKVHGLELGGDDYLTKPFAVAELVARTNALLRRGNPRSERLVLADLELDDRAHEVRRAGEYVDLTPTEYRLLRFMLANARTVLSREQLLEHVWDYDFRGDAGILETYISYLRKKVDIAEPKLIHTVRGVGYVMRTPRDEP